MTAAVIGPREWSASKTDDGHREYKVSFLILSDFDDGPIVIGNATGLPSTGDSWKWPLTSPVELDNWSFCTAKMNIKPHSKDGGDKHKYWIVEREWSSKPKDREQNQPVEDPLLEPPIISGGFTKYTEEATYDRNGKAIKTSSFEMLRGSNVEFDKSRPTVRIEINLLDINLPLVCSLIDCVNDTPLWGLPARCVKLSNVAWSRKVYGENNFYYTITYDFDISYDTFDREVLDVGTKALHGENVNGAWVVKNIQPGNITPSKTNPAHFKKYTDTMGDASEVILDGNGVPETDLDDPYKIKIEKYAGANLLLLGVPVSW